jgi:Patatin-like phospholipase
MRNAISFLSLSIAFFALGGCTSMPAVQVRTWDTTTGAVYPERDDPDYKVPWLAQKHDFGVAFSGGGTRAAAATLGQLRALECLGWLDRTRYASAVSGGAWAAVPYLYLPSPAAEDVFLGEYVPPDRLTDAHLAIAPERSLTRAMNSAFPVWGTLGHLVRGHGDESYTAALGDIFLRPFGLGDRSKFFSSHSEVVDRIVAANPHIDRDDFLLPQYGTPYILVGGTLIGKPRPGVRRDYFPVEMTPLYAGMIDRPRDPKHENETHFLGGGFVESFGYDSKLTLPGEGSNRRVTIGLPRYRMTLSDVIGTSGAAPQSLFLRLMIDNAGLPEFRQWPVDAVHAERETHFGDGGHVENIGLMPLLARKVSNILVFINTATPFEPELNKAGEVHLYDDLVQFFRKPRTLRDGKVPQEMMDPNFDPAESSDPPRVVIESGDAKLAELHEAFTKARKAKQPLVHCAKYNITDNPRFGVTAYKNASICWVYLDRTQSWIDALDEDKNPALKRAISWRSFPHYKTFFARGTYIIRLRPRDANTLSNLTAWTVISQQGTIGPALGLPPASESACSNR